jgi:hypothetical protein
MLGSALAAMGALLVASGAQALPLLSEVYYDAPGTDDGQLFVELYGVPGTVLDGLFVEGINGSNGSATDTIALSGVIPADGIFVVADEASGGGTLVADADLLASFDFQNGPDSVVLRDDANVIDALGYGVFDPGEVFAGEGTPAPDVSAGSSLARLFADLDTDDNAADWIPLGTPTPGQASLAAVPEPGAALLLALGLVGLASVGRSDGRPAAHA